MKFYKINFCLFLALAMSNVAVGQSTVSDNSWGLQLNVQHHDIGVDLNFGQLGVVNKVGIRPYYTLAAQYSIPRKANRKRVFSAELGYYHDLYHERWISAKLGIGTEWTFLKRCYLNMRTELGVAGIKNADLQYKFDGEKWIVTDNTAPYRLGVIISPRLDLGYRIVEGTHPIEVVATGQVSLVGSEVGILPYVAYGLGIRYGL